MSRGIDPYHLDEEFSLARKMGMDLEEIYKRLKDRFGEEVVKLEANAVRIDGESAFGFYLKGDVTRRGDDVEFEITVKGRYPVKKEEEKQDSGDGF